MIKLDKRLNILYNEINDCENFADVGCDHGKIICKVVAENKCKTAVAIDISEKSLEKAKKLAQNLEIADKIKFIKADGLTECKNDIFDNVVIAGMGSYEIIKIINESPKLHKSYTLLPHCDEFILRRFLINNNLQIVKDFVFFYKNKFYNLIKAFQNSNQKIEEFKEINLYYGLSNNILNTDFLKFLDHDKERLLKIKKKIYESQNLDINYLKEIDKQLIYNEEARHW